MPKKRKAQAGSSCEVQDLARRYLESIGLHGAYFDSRHDRCYCERCYPARFPNTIANDGPTDYVVPRGWFRFGLALPPKAVALDIFETWSVSFHGTKSPFVLESILECGQLMKSGDRLLNGRQLRSTKCAGRQDRFFFTSPTIKYGGLRL